MIDVIGPLHNYSFVPTPVLDETDPKGYRVEQRLQVVVKAASNERQYTIEFRLGEGSQAPSEEQLNAWIASEENVQAFCSGFSSRPFVHQAGKQYQARGSEREVNGEKIVLDSFTVFAGVAMAPLGDDSPLAPVVKQVRADFKRTQRAYQAQRNADKAQEREAQLEERAKQMLARKKQQEEEKAATQAAADAASANGRPTGRK